MSHLTYRHSGGSIVGPVEKKPFRKSDLRPREQLAEWWTELSALETWERDNTTWEDWPRSDHPSKQRIEELKKNIRSLDYWFNDSASNHKTIPAPPPITLAEINKRNAEYYGG